MYSLAGKGSEQLKQCFTGLAIIRELVNIFLITQTISSSLPGVVLCAEQNVFAADFFLDKRLRAFILALILTAFLFGFADLVWDRNFERLHIFLFNLCAGGFIILYHTETKADHR